MNEVISAQTVTKGEFARLINVSPGRISQYISSGQIGPDALQGQGRAARIIVGRARRQLSSRLDVAQRVGLNGMTTRIGTETPLLDQPEISRPVEVQRSTSDIVAEQIASEKLKQARMQTSRAEREDALAAGRYMLTDDARIEVTRAVALAYRVMEGGLADMATYLAGQFEFPQRDILHHLQKAFRDVRERATQGFIDAQKNEPETFHDTERNETDDLTEI